MPIYEEPPLEFFEYTGPLPETLTQAEAVAAEAASVAKLRLRQAADDRAAAARKAALPDAPRGKIIVEFLMDCEGGDEAPALMLSPKSRQKQQQQAAGLSTLDSSQMWIKSAYGDMDLEPF